MKNLYIAEKPSVATEFANALGIKTARKRGYIEDNESIITWCVGHLVSMSYPEEYDEIYKRWSFDTLPFIPEKFKYGIIPAVKEQFDIVSDLLNREDVANIYICTDSGREGEYIYRLVDEMAGVKNKTRLRVWIDSQTKEEILRGIKEAKDWSEYKNLGTAAYLRAKEDYLMGINFSRAMTLKYSYVLRELLKKDKAVVRVGRVMTCVLGMVVRKEREIRDFVKTPFYKVISTLKKEDFEVEAEWKAVKGSKYFESPKLYKENGFKEKDDANTLINLLREEADSAKLIRIEKKKETKYPPLLYNLAEIQNEAAKMFKISPDETLKIIQKLYEDKLVTYPRTDARVLSTAVSKDIIKNIKGLSNIDIFSDIVKNIIDDEKYKGIAKTNYVNDSQITDHYAIIPTGQTGNAFNRLSDIERKLYLLIVKRFLSIFLPPARYEKYVLEFQIGSEHLFANFKITIDKGYLSLYDKDKSAENTKTLDDSSDIIKDKELDNNNLALLKRLKKQDAFEAVSFKIKEGETSPPKRYSSGSMILAMENAGKLIEDDELRSQIRGSGIGTSATRAEILKKLFDIKYLSLNSKTQIITPSLLGELIYEAVNSSLKQLLNPELTASWEKGLTLVSNGEVTEEEYMQKLESFVSNKTELIKQSNRQYLLKDSYKDVIKHYK